MGKQRWPGGYVHRQQNGQPLYVIERRVNGQRFHVSTRCHNLTSAMKQLERFEKEPMAYQPAGDAVVAPLRLTTELVLGFKDWQLAKGNTQKHANEMSNRLKDWLLDFAGADLRRVTLREHIKPSLDARETCRPHRIIALKSFYGWLRKEKHLLTSAQDPTLDLPVPQAVPEKRKRKKAVPLDVVRAALEHLSPAYRDMLLVLGGTGWHVTELERFVRRPESEIIHAKRGDTLAVLVTLHKVGEMTRTPVANPDVLAAAERLRARGELPRRPNEALRAACEAGGVKPFTYGVMRHTVATWSIEEGGSPALVSAFLNHKDQRTTARFYTDVSVPTVQVPLPNLRLISRAD